MKNKDEIDMKQPMMVSSHDIKLDAEYAEWIAEVKHRYRSAQVKAAVKVNAEKLLCKRSFLVKKDSLHVIYGA